MDETPEDDQIILTKAEWEELIAALRRLAAANTSLLESIARLLSQASAAPCPDGAPAGDPYDLQALRRLMDGGR